MRFKDWLWIIGFALLIMAINVAISIVYMIVYGYIINPGQPESHYQEHVQIAAPYSSIIAGIPLFYLAGRVLTQRWPSLLRVQAVIAIVLVYSLIDIALLLVAGFQLRRLLIVAISLGTKFIAAYLGGKAAATAKP